MGWTHGGMDARTIVSRYGMEGWIEDFSSGLNTGRWGHGCTSFMSGGSERVIKSLFEVDKKTFKNFKVSAGHRGLGRNL